MTDKAQLIHWATGWVPDHTADRTAVTLVVDPDDVAAVLAGSLGHGRTVFAPSGAQLAGPSLDGRLAEPGDEACLDGTTYIEVQAYAMAAFLAVPGPTLLRVHDADDLRSFIADADAAERDGTFAEHLLNPLFELADQNALGLHSPHGGPTHRLYVEGGQVSTSPGGAVLGTVDDTLEQVELRWQDAGAYEALSRRLTPGALAGELAERPWMDRYLRAVRLLRYVAAMGLEATAVSGFGDGRAKDLAPGSIISVTCTDRVLAHDPLTGRTFTVNAETAGVLEALTSAPSAEDLEDVLPSALITGGLELLEHHRLVPFADARAAQLVGSAA
ncbi:daptide biosynthesis RiPP recognition protein [Luteipulveratus mongoliensis]|uniref:Uncharacterized protein n=1 Tax=Luteipulveratus mongoliensis TaxID=571913 RepID=A0A0K1JEE2_9MICO|nr:daptide biosynthesis RiPP recognition protein [Luteipulveratus mongoliensis]AKU14963.1 hypothetical protein VV02_02245 [Luteipulveratus mongoliensis]